MQLKEENLSLEMLKSNGLMQKPLVLRQNYAHFEIVEQQTESLFSRNHSLRTAKSSSDNGSLSPCVRKLPPTRLLQSDKTAKPPLTSDQIEEKILKANLRKKVTQSFFEFGNFFNSCSIMLFVTIGAKQAKE